MNIDFNNHDRVIFNGLLYSVKFRSWSADRRCYTLGLVAFHSISPLIWVPSDLVKKVS